MLNWILRITGSAEKETLENLAKNIAYKVRKTRKAVSLEPMNPYERRIIHSALQEISGWKPIAKGKSLIDMW